MNAIETIKHRGCTIKIFQDEDPEHPRKHFDNLGKIVHWHRDYDFGQRINDVDEWLTTLASNAVENNYPESLLRPNRDAILRKHYTILPVALLDHSGLRMWIGSGPADCDAGGWDSGQVGYIYCSLEDVQKNWMNDSLTWDSLIPWHDDTKISVRDATIKVLTGEVETYDQYLSGDVYGYESEDWDGNDIGSCWGFFGYDCAIKDMVDQAKAEIDSYISDAHQSMPQPGDCDTVVA